MAQINFTIEVVDGKATIRLPEGRRQKSDAAALEDLTLKISDALGDVEERHIGDHVHTYLNNDGTTTTTKHNHLHGEH
jgi:hypothetical protein